MANDVSSLIQQAAQSLGIDVSVEQRQSLQDYLVQLQRWNKTYNLTAIRDPQQMLVQHVFDSLAVVAPLRRHASADTALHILDIGSGAGLPGIIIGIMQPNWRITCVDAVEKKTAFIRQAASVLRLKNVAAQHNRIEMIQPLQANLAVSRAFASLKDFAELTQTHIVEGGRLLAMKGKIPDDEISELERETDWRVDATEQLEVPMLDAQRCLLWLKRRESHEPG